MASFALRLALSLMLLVPIPFDAADAGQRSSGGYTLPSSGGYSRPSVGGNYGGYTAPRRPSTGSSGGYGLPSGGGSNYGGRSYGGDTSMSRQSSGDALSGYRASQQPQVDTRRPSTGSGYGSGYSGGTGYGYGSGTGGWDTRRPSAGYGGYGGGAPAFSQQRFGVWDGLLLWGLLNSLSSPGRSSFFYNNQNDPGYQQWRTQADQAAQNDAELRAKLAQLDQQLAQMQGQPRTTAALPPDVATRQAASEHSGGSIVWIILLLGIGVFVLLWVWRRRAARTEAQGTVPQSLKGSADTRFRVGMTFPADPAPFLLAAGKTKVTPPPGGNMMSVETIGVIVDRGVALNRLYLPGGNLFFQIHLGADGKPDECRYFSKLDEVQPASQEEWGAWLDPAQGMIGWPQFQTKDGKMYDRVWSPGQTRIDPIDLDETRQDLKGTSSRKLHSMLYGAATGAAAPAPQTEYILVSAIEEAGQAWVEIHAGIDINPATLTLPTVSFTA